jgi:histidinol phosphatase-like enzyme
MKYMVDIDGTICSVVLNPDGSADYDQIQPHKDRIEKINQLFDAGHEITYWTARGSASGIDRSQLTRQQMAEWGAKYHELLFHKPVYDVWIDDKAVNSEVYFK